MKRRWIVGVALVLAAGAAAGISFAGSSDRPDRPPFRVDKTSGQPVIADLPENVPVLDANGRVSGYVSRETFKVAPPTQRP